MTRTTPTAALALLAASTASAGVLTTTTLAPVGATVLQQNAAGASNSILARNTGNGGSTLQSGGQSFTNASDFTLTGVTLQNAVTRTYGNAGQPNVGILNLFVTSEGTSGALDVLEGTATFDLSGRTLDAGEFLNFNLDATESAGLGTLSGGELYGFSFSFASESPASQNLLNVNNNTTDVYAGGTRLFLNSPTSVPISATVPGQDLQFYVQGVNVPEPASAGLLAAGGLMLLRRRGR